jgi:maltoporin
MNNKKLKKSSLSLIALFCASTLGVNAEERPHDLSEADIIYVKKLIANEAEAESKKQANNSFEFNGYFRTGANTVVGGGAKNGGSCYALNYPKNDGIYYRLANECRDYGEFQFTKNQQINGVNFKAVWMLDIAGDSRSSTAVEPWSRRSRQLYVESDNLLDNGTLWMGRRYYRGVAVGDVHILDYFHAQSSGNGVGVTDIMINDTDKLHVAAILYGDEGADLDVNGVTDPTTQYDYQNIMADVRYEMDLGDTGKLKFVLQSIFVNDAYDNVDMSDGSTITMQWEKKLGIVDQKTVFQYGIGAMARNPGSAGTDGGSFDYTADSNASGFRIFNNGNIEITPKFTVNYMAMYEKSDDYHTLKSIGIRPHYSLSKYFSLVGELGYNAYQKITNGIEADEQRLMKYALALQATTDSTNFWARPSLRFYVSNFDWNGAAGQQSGLNAPGNDGDENALVVGVQSEIWF